MTGRRPLPPFPRLQCCEKLFAHSGPITVTYFVPNNIEVGGGRGHQCGIVRVNVIFMLATSNIYIFLKSFVVPCSHFLFSYQFYVTQRITLVTRVNEILHTAIFNHLENQPQVCLYDDPSLSNPVNKKIILSTIMYIKETQRFST